MINLYNAYRENTSCNYKSGYLEPCSPLAMAYTPLQQSYEPSFDKTEALAKGTLFPGLELPFMNMINKVPKNPSPLEELMAIDFVVQELTLYLDTHKNDKEAFKMYQDFLNLTMEARKRYTEMFGPISQTDMRFTSEYTWLEYPWPWEYEANMEG